MTKTDRQQDIEQGFVSSLSNCASLNQRSVCFASHLNPGPVRNRRHAYGFSVKFHTVNTKRIDKRPHVSYPRTTTLPCNKISPADHRYKQLNLQVYLASLTVIC